MAYFISGFLAVLAIAGGAFYFLTHGSLPTSQPATAPQQQQVVEQPKPEPSISVDSPTPNEQVSGEIEVLGKAQGSWFFEGSFPVTLVDDTGATVAQGVATAAEEWMTEKSVPFIATIDIADVSAGSYSLVFTKDNPSGLPENDESFTVPVTVASE